jgi:hypothetical protein
MIHRPFLPGELWRDLSPTPTHEGRGHFQRHGAQDADNEHHTGIFQAMRQCNFSWLILWAGQNSSLSIVQALSGFREAQEKRKKNPLKRHFAGVESALPFRRH